jgi:hypothetical protein
MRRTPLGMLILACFIGYSCKEEDYINSSYITERLKFDINKQIILDHLDSIKIKEIIKLNVDSALPLGRIDKIVVTKDRLFILDRTFSKFLFVYDRLGNLLYVH